MPFSSVLDHAASAASPGAALLSRSTIVSMRRALHAFRDGWTAHHLVERAAGHIADDARRAGASAAHMVIALKQAWASLPDVRHLAPGVERQLRERMVACSIEAYFAQAAA